MLSIKKLLPMDEPHSLMRLSSACIFKPKDAAPQRTAIVLSFHMHHAGTKVSGDILRSVVAAIVCDHHAPQICNRRIARSPLWIHVARVWDSLRQGITIVSSQAALVILLFSL